jgi:hypothetical protein
MLRNPAAAAGFFAKYESAKNIRFQKKMFQCAKSMFFKKSAEGSTCSGIRAGPRKFMQTNPGTLL